MKKSSDNLIIDFHSHILPTADHGSDSIETSLAQLKIIEKAGVDIVVATPHFYPYKDNIKGFLERREKAAKLLAEKKDSKIKVALGAEVYAVAGMEELSGIENLTIKGTNTLLLEMPFSYWNTNIINTVMKLDERFDLVLAHIDRYPTKDVNRLLEIGIKAQVNARNAIRHRNRKHLIKWLSEDDIWAIGSDIHGKDNKALKSFKKAQKLMKYDISDIFKRSEKLLSGAEFI